MFIELFSDTVMFVLALATWLIMAAIMILLLRWHDIEWLWVLAFLVPQTMLLYSYFLLWETPDTPIRAFPVLAAFARPGAFGVWLIIVLFSVYRLRQKMRTRKLL